ncbi:DUF1830 domain-containing protein [Pleurocapsales cyanobacterium LEGE 10410]|nr:DUF1830 domain-containing protein [Pleurocapsales cyanobacterium LEGE 10410]
MLSSSTQPNRNLALCCYVNATAHVEVIRITNIPHWYFERVAFPGQRLIFNAPVEAKLEVHTGMKVNSILSKTIDCQKLLLINDDGSLPSST